jgi:hypothetical protein
MTSERKRSLSIRFIFILAVIAVLNLQTNLLQKTEIYGQASQPDDAPGVSSAGHRSSVRSVTNSTTPVTLTFVPNDDVHKLKVNVSTAEIKAVAALSQDRQDTKCALLFFGLVKDFQELALPSIQKNIIVPNPHCDIFLHTYNITVTRISRRNLETPYEVKIDEAYLLTDNVTMDTDLTFENEHHKFLRRTRRLYHREWGVCCRSHDNMIKQWHSIKRVWDLMVDHERMVLGQGNDVKSPGDYKHIGLFRSDVYYTSPINIFDSNATLPNFASYKGYNDRFFYGQRQHAAVWADRFSFAQTFERKYMVSSITRGKKRGYHSETFLYHLMNHFNVPVVPKNICAWRIRAGSRLSVEDCTRDAKWFANEDIPKYLPTGYALKIVNDTRVLRNGTNRTTTSLWGFPPEGNEIVIV